ncbi:diguanylate cyclase [Duganella sp. FT134W]|uniref:diguanylate cyclase n=1 Tax=Duganella margarita TaxID=2692170 RepID=A0A7X4GZZ2_9BURK|nr:ligand-binding sensor domain-containing diguanylate cyclase [Duganella margarita]MYM72109.1 diguanylate cyclase [Duganella margarita]
MLAPFPALRRLLFLCLLLALSAASITSAAPSPSLRFKKLGPLAGDEPSMLSLIQDRKGFVWVGTHTDGLYRYNGYQAVKYTSNPADPASLPHDRVSSIFEDRQGRIWAATQNGLARFNPDTNNFTTFTSDKAPKNHRIVKNIISDGKDGLWIGTWGGLQHFDPRSGKFDAIYAHSDADPDSLASNDLNALALDAQGGVWIGTWPGGLDYLAPGAKTFRHHQVDPAAKPDARVNIVRALQFDTSGALWIGTESGIIRWDGKSDWDTRKAIVSPYSRITNFGLDNKGVLWATTLSAGLLRWNEADEAFDQFVHAADDPYSLPGDNLRAVMQDRSGMLWIASFTDGIALANLSSEGFTRHVPFRIDSRSAPASNALLSLSRAPNGKMWLGGNVGMSLYDPATSKVLRSYHADDKVPGKLSHSIVYSMYQDDDGKGPLWLGTSNGLNRLDTPDSPFQAIHFGNTASDYINAIAPGAGGVLWLATGNSLIRYEIKTDLRKIYYNDPQDPTSRSVNGTSAVLEDRQGRVWAGSEWNGGGLDLLDQASGKFRHYRHSNQDANSLSDDNIASLHEDAQGRIWVGTSKGLNLVVFKPDGAITFKSYAAAMRAPKILSIQHDHEGKIWCSTITGLYRLEPDSGKVTHFTASDGLTEGFTVNSSALGADGTLFFGGVHGMTAVTPSKVKTSSVPPQVAITDITVFNHSLQNGQPSENVKAEGPVTAPTALTLSSQASVFALEFAALHYTEPSGNRYSYQLQGFDRDWVETDASHRTASYTNLNPGKYIFRVKAANHLGVWNQVPATLNITITPPFWQRWWFRSGLMALVVGSLALAYKVRITRLTRHQAELEQTVAARTVELEESNRKLAALSTTDGLTGVSNRRGFDLALEAEWRRAARTGQTLALSMLDVDYFKKYNDHYGHLAGDAALRTVADLITTHGRRTTDLVARYGGEEFALLAAATDSADAFGVAQDICAELARRALPHEQSPFGIMTISIGVAVMVPSDDTSPQDLVQLADRALYRAKEKGRNMALLAMPPM